jgi:hypothetical protein
MRISRLAAAVLVALLLGCAAREAGDGSAETPAQQSRYSGIPPDAVKMGPGTDIHPPQLHSAGWEEPVPLGSPVDTAGAEDSPFIYGDDLYFFFTPDVSVPPEKQVLDNLTGIYVSRREGSGWSEPERVALQDRGKLSLDGCEFVQGDAMWFCSAREGFTGLGWFTAEYRDGRWQGWKPAGFDPDYQVGELHISADGKELYFHSDRPGGEGGLDIWVSRNEGGAWQEPEDVEAVNTEGDEGWPFLTPDGKELWFTRTYRGSPAVFRSVRENGAWSGPELIISDFAGEPTLDGDGDIFFVHHFFRDSKMIEADIYVAKKKKSE